MNHEDIDDEDRVRIGRSRASLVHRWAVTLIVVGLIVGFLVLAAGFLLYSVDVFPPRRPYTFDPFFFYVFSMLIMLGVPLSALDAIRSGTHGSTVSRRRRRRSRIGCILWFFSALVALPWVMLLTPPPLDIFRVVPTVVVVYVMIVAVFVVLLPRPSRAAHPADAGQLGEGIRPCAR